MNRITYILGAITLALPLFASCGKAGKDNSRPTLIYRKTMTLSSGDLSRLEREQDSGTYQESSRMLLFASNGPHVVLCAGPESDMLSYEIQGHKNPTLVFRKGALVTMTVANIDPDMSHDLLIGGAPTSSSPVPDTVGAMRVELLPQQANGFTSANEIAFHANSIGTYTYFCSVPGHGGSGMRGAMIIATPGVMDSLLRAGQSAVERGAPDSARQGAPLLPGIGGSGAGVQGMLPMH